MELFLFFAIIMQNFRFKSPQAPEDIYVPPKPVGFTRVVPYFTMSFLPRWSRSEAGMGKLVGQGEKGGTKGRPKGRGVAKEPD